jgi:PIN domain nuclease of toxin-antitoxin system
MSQILLDTHVLLWSVYDIRRIPKRVARVIQDPAHDVLFSAVAILEIAIKSALRRPDFNFDPMTVINAATAMGFAELPLIAAAAARVSALPSVHKDPFDRLLIAQALYAPARLLTADRLLARYSELVEPFDPL